MSKNLKNIGVVASATMVSRVLGLVREMLTARFFGTSALASAYATAFQLPNLFRRLLAEGGMTAAFVPTMNEELEHRNRDAAFALVSQVASWLFVVSSALVVAAMLGLAQHDAIAALGRAAGADAATIERWLLAARLAVVLFPYLVFVCLAAVFSAALQTLHRFLEPALSPVWLNVAMIGLLGGAVWSGVEADNARMNWLCAGVLLGGFLQMAVPAWALTREGWRPRLDLRKSDAVRAIARLMLPTVFGSAVYLINMTVSRFVGLSLNDAAVSVLNYATRFMELPIGVFAVAVSTVVFPLISRYATQGDFGRLGIEYRKGMRLILAINIPAAAGLVVLAAPLIQLFFEYGKFARDDTRLMTPVLVVYALGLPFLSFVSLALRAFYARKDTVTPLRGALLSFAVNLALSLALMGPLSTVGLAVAGNAATIAQAWYLQRHLTKKMPTLALGHLAGDLAKIALASVVMGGAVWAAWHGWRALAAGSKPTDALGLALAIALGVAVYGGLIRLLRIESLDELIAMLRARGKTPADPDSKSETSP